MPASDPGAGRTLQEAIRVQLTGTQKRTLQKISGAHTSEQRMALRARIVLWANLGFNNCQIADQLGIDVKTVRKWRGRFCLNGLEGLHDEPRSGRPFRFDSGVRNEVFTAVVGDPPEPFGVWTLDLLAKHLVDNTLVGSISIETISYWLRTADIKPHRVRGWLHSNDPNFREKRDRIAGLYRNPPSDGELLSVDEKTSIPARGRIRKDGPLGPGRRKTHEWEYVRHGTAHLLASFNVRTGEVIAEIPSGKNDSDAFINFLKRLMRRHPRRKLYLILDNGTTHKSKKTKAFFARHPRLVPVYTPTHASWLNQIEIWFSVMSRQALRKVSFSSREKLVERLLAYIETHNREMAMPYEWSTKDKPLTGVTARERRRSRSTARAFRKAFHC
jgi:transposase